MTFSSIIFLFAFLPVTLLCYYFVPLKWRNLVLLAFSLVFYGWGEPLYVFLMVFNILVSYLCGLKVERWRSTPRAKTWVAVSAVISLAALGFFKYYDFIAGSISSVTGLALPLLGVPLPIGISFYTFQTMSYTIDVYRQDAPLQKNIVKFGAYVTMYPQLIAGPIVKYKDVADQLDTRRHSLELFSSGAARFTAGLCKKVLLADSAGVLWNEAAATPYGELSVLGAVIGMLAFSFQLYFDFSGYSDMAVGLGRMIGFEFMENFNYPYIARSITDFWRRWHISLSTWFREYVYIPLGGNRVSKLKNYRNIFVVWLLTGIWHGANWNFVLWGLYFAVLLMLEKAFVLRILKKLPRFAGHAYTLVLVALSWMIFKIEDFAALGLYFKSLFGLSGAGLANSAALYDLRSCAVLFALMAAGSTPLVKKLYEKLPSKVRLAAAPALVLAGLALSAAFMTDASYNQFLYFRF